MKDMHYFALHLAANVQELNRHQFGTFYHN